MINFTALIKDMSLEDKLMQLTQLMGELYIDKDNGMFMGLSYGFEIDDYMTWNTGSILGLGEAKDLKKIQKEYLERSNHKIPLLFMQDVIHGYRTIFPTPLACACSWEPEVFNQMGIVSAKEASVSGIHVALSPMVDLGRDPRWGRVVEGTGEDVYLNGLYAEALVNGYQGKNVGEKYKVASCVKHFAAYGMAEGGRDYNTTEVSEYSLNENHFPAYKKAIDAGCEMVMTAFNALNGVPASGNRWLLHDKLRKDWNFDGVVISDCTAIAELVPHGFASDDAEAAEKAINAGVDIEMVSTHFFRNAKKLLAEGLIDESTIDESVLNVLKLKEKLGLFENPYKDADEELEKKFHLCEDHKKTAKEAAEKSIVILENDGILPLKKDSSKKISLIGPFGKCKDLFDVWKAAGKPEETPSLFEVLNKCSNVTYSEGANYYDLEDSKIEEAISTAKDSDLVILALGEEPDKCGEAGSRAILTLSDGQLKLVDEIYKLNKKTIIILFNGRPLEIKNIVSKANAIVEAWLPGTEGASAITNIIFGDALPQGHLTMSFPHCVGQCPVYYNAYPTGRPKPNEETTERFYSGYIDIPNSPLYPFGYGLSYTKFQYSEVTVSNSNMKLNGSITASITLKNIGKRTGIETVQLYIRDLAGSMVRPLKQLKGFKKVKLEPNEECVVEFEITEDMLAFNTMFNGFSAEKGKFKVFICENSAHENFAEFELV